jgi:hypothetical protein
MPLGYILYKSKIKIIQNYKIDRIFKASLIILLWICLFLTKSPIYIVMCIIYTLIFFAKDILKMFKRFIIILPILLVILSVSFFSIESYLRNQFQSEDNILFRVKETIESFGDLDKLIAREESLATRFITTINTYQAFKSVLLFGSGYGNTKNIMYKQYLKTNIPLTQEIIEKQIRIDRVSASPNIFWGMLLQTGIIGIALLYLFFIKSIYAAHKIKIYFIGKAGLLLESSILIAINYIIISFYWSFETYPIMWFIFGLLNLYILIYKKNIKNNHRQIITEAANEANF